MVHSGWTTRTKMLDQFAPFFAREAVAGLHSFDWDTVQCLVNKPYIKSTYTCYSSASNAFKSHTPWLPASGKCRQSLLVNLGHTSSGLSLGFSTMWSSHEPQPSPVNLLQGFASRSCTALRALLLSQAVLGFSTLMWPLFSCFALHCLECWFAGWFTLAFVVCFYLFQNFLLELKTQYLSIAFFLLQIFI